MFVDETFWDGHAVRPFRQRAAKNFAGTRKEVFEIYASLVPGASTINFGLPSPLSPFPFQKRISRYTPPNGTTNHRRNDLDAGRSAIIITCAISPPFLSLPIIPLPFHILSSTRPPKPKRLVNNRLSNYYPHAARAQPDRNYSNSNV